MDNEEKTELDIFKQNLKEYLKNQIDMYERWKKEAKAKLTNETTYDHISANVITKIVDEYKYYEHRLTSYEDILTILEEFDKEE